MFVNIHHFPFFATCLLKQTVVKKLCKDHEHVAQVLLFTVWSWEKYWQSQEVVKHFNKPQKLFLDFFLEAATMQAAQNFRSWAFEHKKVYYLTNKTNVYYQHKKS
ncbi:MAG TPA: hypothetical protein QGF02_04745 [Candidatus Babeliales bacterium]|nr:hypothetical protein [Candidatus Babeliales bacterium]